MGWTWLCCSEAMSDVVRAVKDQEAAKKWLQWAVKHL